jgi:hypothetical protein
MSTLSVGTIKSGSTSAPPIIQTSTGTEVGTFCRAWVNFNGTGTVAIRAQFNVSSITDNGTGDYTVNFTTAMPDANYSAMGAMGSPDAFRAQFAIGENTNGSPGTVPEGVTKLAGSCRFITGVGTGAVDPGSVNVAIFR